VREVDKSQWQPGPWEDEPDKVQWQDEATGLACLALRDPTLGYWCGYVGLSASHPYFAKHYDALDIDVHGGLSFSEFDVHEQGKSVAPGEPDRVWWLGFDCCHYLDLAPGMVATLRSNLYRDLSYVKKECAQIARQLKDKSTNL
jgi:hypothetical protein